MTCIRRNLDTQNCCNQWQKGIRTIDNQYPDDNREFKISGGAGILITPITAGILITNTTDPAALEAGSNIELTPNGDHLQIGVVDGPTFNDDTTVNGDLNVNGNIYNQGASYESHMEQVYTTDDYIIMRDNAVTGLGSGDYAGFQVKKYDGTNDGRLVIDNSGIARVGDVGDEQPLLTRDESADLTNGDSLIWDSANSKAITAAIPSAIGTALNGKENTLTPVMTSGSPVTYITYGKLIIVSVGGANLISANNQTITTGLPAPLGGNAINFVLTSVNGQMTAVGFILSDGTLQANASGTMTAYGSFAYIKA